MKEDPEKKGLERFIQKNAPVNVRGLFSSWDWKIGSVARLVFDLGREYQKVQDSKSRDDRQG